MIEDKRRDRKALTKILASLCMDCWFWLQQLLKSKNQLQTSVFTELKFEEPFLTRKLNQKLKLDNHFMQDFARNFAASQELIRTLDCQHHHCRKLMNLSVSIIAENIWNESQFEHHCRKQTQECCWICLQFEKNWSLFFLSMREFCKCSSFGSRTLISCYNRKLVKLLKQKRKEEKRASLSVGKEERSYRAWYGDIECCNSHQCTNCSEFQLLFAARFF